MTTVCISARPETSAIYDWSERVFTTSSPISPCLSSFITPYPDALLHTCLQQNSPVKLLMLALNPRPSS